jgi:8-amino-7-oxononanoate synthase
VLDFTSALYLGLQHPSCALAPWRALTTGAPAALTEPMEARKIARALAGLQGCEAAVLGTSTLHLAWDLFGLLAEKPIAIFVDAGVYPITRWGVQRAAMRGATVSRFLHHNAESLERSLAVTPPGRMPVIVTDGLCPNCGSVPPLADYLALARKGEGLLVMDDTQALGVLGHLPNESMPYGSGGGGSLPWSGTSGPEALVFSSLAKGFGVPLAVLAASRRWIRRFKERSLTRVHCSPPSIAALRAAQRALELNHKCADSLRRRLAQLVGRFQEELQAFGIHTRGGRFPIQTLVLPGHVNPVALHDDLESRGLRTVLRKSGNDARPQITLMLNARQAPGMFCYAAAVIADALAAQGIAKQHLNGNLAYA